MANRYLIRPLPPPGEHDLPADLAHHLVRVLRVRAGAVLVLFDGDGLEAEATVLSSPAGGGGAAARRGLRVAVAAPRAGRNEPDVELHLAFAPPKGARAEWLIEHGCEVGVAAFHPLQTERGQRIPDRRDRWNRVLVAAAGQCDRARLPICTEPADLPTLLGRPDLPAARWVATPGAPPLELPARVRRALVVVGPEGGFTPSEQATLEAAGCTPFGLGRLVLRTETAALVAAASFCCHGDAAP